MPIPKEILAVKRPVNTIVIVYGKNKNHYAVRQRVGCRLVDGRHIPINGPTIGHIQNGVYVPKSEHPTPVSQDHVDLKDWANIQLCDSLFSDILAELRKLYNEDDALKIYCITLLRVCNPGISDYELKEAYEDSFLSELYPGVAMHRITICTFLNNLGKTCSRIVEFMRRRAESIVADHHILIDGTLKSDESKVNTLSDFSRKAKTKGTRDISILYAVDLETMEPVCSKRYLGNMVDARSYADFLEEYNLTKGLIVGDKGFPMGAATNVFNANKDLHYLNPIKRNAKVIKTYDMLNYEGALKGNDGVLYKKVKCKNCNKYLYAFRDANRAAKEEHDYLKRSEGKNKFNDKDFKERQATFGVIIFECDLNLDPEVVFKAYSRRWEIEVIMRFYKSACDFDKTRVHDDYSNIGSEFCDFLASLLTCRLIKRFDNAKLLEEETYKRLMSILRRCKKIYTHGKWKLIRINNSYVKMLQQLGLLEAPAVQEKKKRGRPRKTTI
ncbi:MAG: transposase [Alistipes sp.]|nr:transposase [Candidatus Alistipes equi]